MIIQSFTNKLTKACLVRSTNMNTKMLITIIFTFFFLNLTGYSAFKDLAAEYLKASSQVKLSDLKGIQSVYDYNKVLNKNDWQLVSTFFDKESNPAALFSFQSVDTHTQAFQLGLSRDFNTGTNLSFGQERIFYDLTKWDEASLSRLADDQLYEVKNRIQITQDLWNNFGGRIQQNLVESAALKKNISHLESRKEKALGLIKLYKIYIATRFNQSLAQLNLVNLSIKKKRQDFIKRRIRDNLSPKVDLYTTDITYYSALDKVESSKNSILENYNELEKILGRKVTEGEIENYDLANLQLLPVTRYTDDQIKNIELKILKRTEELRRLKLQEVDYQKSPSLTLSFSLINNAIDETTAVATANAWPYQDNQEKIIRLDFKMPLGFNVLEQEKNIAQIELQRTQLEAFEQSKELNFSLASLLHRLELLEEKLKIAQQKKIAANLATSENSKRFYQGQIELDTLLRSEEELYEADYAIINQISQYDLLIADYYYLTGHLYSQLLTYPDEENDNL
jgi:outer membrane protein